MLVDSVHLFRFAIFPPVPACEFAGPRILLRILFTYFLAFFVFFSFLFLI